MVSLLILTSILVNFTFGFIIIGVYDSFRMPAVCTNVRSYRLRVRIMLSFLGALNLILIPVLAGFRRQDKDAYDSDRLEYDD